MVYEINIAKNGQHYFATHERSISTIEKATEIHEKLSKVFPESEGYKLSLTKWEKIGKEIKINGTSK
jgi:hypothetical protein